MLVTSSDPSVLLCIGDKVVCTAHTHQILYRTLLATDAKLTFVPPVGSSPFRRWCRGYAPRSENTEVGCRYCLYVVDMIGGSFLFLLRWFECYRGVMAAEEEARHKEKNLARWRDLSLLSRFALFFVQGRLRRPFFRYYSSTSTKTF